MEASVKRFSATLPALAVLAVAGCATYDTSPPVATAPASGAIVTAPAATVTAPAGTAVVVPQPVVAFKPGSGQIESISMLRVAQPASASAGSSSSSPLMAYRLSVRMDDGTLQTIDQDNRSFLVGDRIRITNDGHVIR
jgi:hypothetical protein